MREFVTFGFFKAFFFSAALKRSLFYRTKHCSLTLLKLERDV
ncbi:MAG: hypothetical protein V7K96_28455 [Nostoc sp.]